MTVNKSFKSGSTASGIKEAIDRRWPCQIIPYGVSVNLAREFNVSRQRVEQILNTLKVKRERRLPRQIRVCAICEEPVKYTTIFCKKHQAVPIECDQCKIIFQRTPAKLTNYENNPLAKGEHYFCSKKCVGQWAGLNYGFGRQKTYDDLNGS